MGKYSNSFADVSMWKRTRVSECKGSGIAKACAAWQRHCRGNVQDIVQDQASQDAAGKAVDQMTAAVKKAQAKLKPVLQKKKITPAMKNEPYSRTRDLLDDWGKEADKFYDRLKKAGAKFHGTQIKRNQFRKSLTIDKVLRDNRLLAHFKKYAKDREHSEKMVDAYCLFKKGFIDVMVKKYGRGNDYNISGEANNWLIDLYINKLPMDMSRKKGVMDHVASSFFQMIEGRVSMFGRWLRHKSTDALIKQLIPFA